MNTSVDISSIKTTFDGLEYDIRLVKSDFLLPTSGPQCSISTFTLIKLCNVFVGLQCRWLRVLFQLSYIKYALCLIHWINQTKSWTHRRTRVFVSCAPCPQESPEILMLHSNNSDSIATYPGTSTWPLLSHRVWDPGYSLLMQSKTAPPSVTLPLTFSFAALLPSLFNCPSVWRWPADLRALQKPLEAPTAESQQS